MSNSDTEESRQQARPLVNRLSSREPTVSVAALTQVLTQAALREHSPKRRLNVEPFTGYIQDALLSFLRAYKLASLAHRWTDPDRARGLFNHVKGPAAVFLANLVDQDQSCLDDWPRLEARFRAEYCTPASEQFHCNRLTNLVQAPGVSVTDYAAALSQAIDNAYPEISPTMKDNLLKTHFPRGLRAEIRSFVVQSKPGASYIKQYSKALGYETSHILLQDLGGPVGPSPVFTATRQQTGYQHPAPQVAPRRITCFNCGREGHYQSDCHLFWEESDPADDA